MLVLMLFHAKLRLQLMISKTHLQLLIQEEVNSILNTNGIVIAQPLLLTPLIKFHLNKSGQLRIIAKKDKKTYGDPVVQHIQLHQGLFKKVNYNTNYSDYYKANQELTLVDGQLGGKEFRDGDWQGFWNTHIDITIDLEKETLFDSLSVHFYQYINSWIFSHRNRF